MKKRYEDPSQYISVGQISAMLNEVFDLPSDERISEPTPYAWWDRSKKNQDISLPMPAPGMYVPGKPLWTQEVLIHWFGAWRSYEVPVGVAAGDRVDARGRRIYSKYRAR